MTTIEKNRLQNAKSFAEVRQLVENLHDRSLDSREATKISRALRKCPDEPDLSIAFLSSHNVEPLVKYVEAYAAIRGHSVNSYLAEFGQYYQEVTDSSSGLIKTSPDFIYAELAIRELSEEISFRFVDMTKKDRTNELDRILDHVENWIDAAAAHTRSILLLSNFPEPDFMQAGIADQTLSFSEGSFYRKLNLELADRLSGRPNVHILDLCQRLRRFGSSRGKDSKMYYLAKFPWTEEFAAEIGEEISRMIIAARGAAKKCLVLDLDNTLWGGVVGEIGWQGIRVGQGDPTGEAFFEFQQVIKSLKGRGILLAICSKNNEEDVAEVFTNRTDMPLCWEDFVYAKVNWESKHKNIRSIAQELNIGLDSIVFVDDNPAECELIRQMLPEVCTVRLPKDPAKYAGALRSMSDFEKLHLTLEDRWKTRQYDENRIRDNKRQESISLEQYLESLGTKMFIRNAGSSDLPRVHQLFSKTNQFNLTTPRYSLIEIEHFILDPDWRLFLIDVSDRFGKLGTVGLCLVEAKNMDARIDSFLLSCRALGRGIETAFMNFVKKSVLASERCEQISASYTPSTKNRPAQDFYSIQGFSTVRMRESGEIMYEFRMENYKFLKCPGITVIEGVDSNG